MASPIHSSRSEPGNEHAKVKSVFKPTDADEQSGKTIAAMGAYLTKLLSSKKQERIFGEGHKLAKVVQTQREKVLSNATLTKQEETRQLKKSIDQEAAQRQEQDNALLSESKSIQKIAIKKFLEKTEGESSKASEYLNTGFEIINQIIDAGKEIDDLFNKMDITRRPEFEAAWESIQKTMTEANASKVSIDSVKEDFIFYVKLSAECVQLDLEIESLENLKKKIEEKKEEISKAESRNKNDLKIELNKLKLQEKTLNKKIEEMQRELSLKGLNLIVSKGTKYVEAVTLLMKTSSTARSLLGKLVKHLTAIGSLVAFKTAVEKMMMCGKKIHETGKKIETLKREQKEIPAHLDPRTKVLISNAYSFKMMHMERSKVLLKAEAAFSMLRAVIASLDLTKASVACIAILFGVVIATPGLNTASAVLGILIVVGITGIDIFHKMKHDRVGTKLELQQNEESVKIFALSGQFHTKSREFEQLRLAFEEVLREEAEMIHLLKSLDEKAKSYSPAQLEMIVAYWEAQLAPIAERRMKLQKMHDEAYSALYMLSLELDATIDQKNVLKEHRSLETLAQEFRLQKSDVFGMKNLFEEVLKEESVREEFIEFLTSQEIAITSKEDVFASVLRFIRTDEEMPGGSNASIDDEKPKRLDDIGHIGLNLIEDEG